MIKRPRQHELETLSRRHFRDALPAAWVPREQQPDYGVDEVVQVFANGSVTPFSFGAQLKGTDGRVSEGVTPRWSFETRHLRHYVTLPFPVMVVLYDARRERLFYRWVHRLFRHSTADELRSWMVQDTVTVAFDAELDSAAMPEIEVEVQRFFEALSPEIVGPVELHVAVDPGDISALRAVERFVSAVSRDAEGSLRVTADSTPERIKISREGVLLEAPGSGLVVSLSHHAPSDDRVEELQAALAACGAMVLAYRHRLRASLALLATIASSRQAMIPAIEKVLCPSVLPLLYASRSVTSALLSTAHLFLDCGAIDLARWLAAGFVFSRSGSALERSEYERLLRRVIDLLPRSTGRASVHYSLANSYRGGGYYRRAVAHYHRAAREDSDYRCAAYWWEEVAACHFLLGKYRWSAQCYATSLGCGGADSHTVPLLADALLRIGRYDEAEVRLSGYLSKAGPPVPVGVLLYWFVRRIRATGEGNLRDSARANELIQRAAECTEDAEREVLWRGAIAADPLSGLPHYNLALLLSCRQESMTAAEEFLCAAICVEADTEAWAYAILKLVDAGHDSEVMTLLFATLAVTQRNRAQVELQIAQKLRESGRAAGQIDLALRSLRELAEMASWSFHPRARSRIRYGGPSRYLMLDGKAVPPG